MKYEQAIKQLYSIDSTIKLGLERMELILSEVGNPHKDIKTVHVAGTNGKGSVCAMISSSLQLKGFKVGVYTSPHMSDFRERFRINEKFISKRDVVKYYKKIKPALKHNPTYFEAITLMAFLYFKEKKVDYLVLEVGLGGRLDATNVVTPLVSIITNVSIDHTRFLGKTVAQISREKAGIIKKGVPVVTTATKIPLSVVKKTAQRKKSKLIVAKKLYSTNLLGDYQKTNAAAAAAALKVIGIPESVIVRGLKKAIWPGRMQFIEKNVLVDSAHNPAGVKALVRNVKMMKPKKVFAVVGIMKDKDYESMVRTLSELKPFFVFCRPDGNRATDPNKLAQYADNYSIIADPKKALAYANKMAGKDLVLVAGSIFTAGEIL